MAGHPAGIHNDTRGRVDEVLKGGYRAHRRLLESDFRGAKGRETESCWSGKKCQQIMILIPPGGKGASTLYHSRGGLKEMVGLDRRGALVGLASLEMASKVTADGEAPVTVHAGER